MTLMSSDDPSLEETGDESALGMVPEGLLPEVPPLNLDVEIESSGACQKQIKVVIPREDIDGQFERSLGEMSEEAVVPGFRPGKAPKRLVERWFRREVAGQVKANLLYAAIQQIEKDNKLNLISQPDLDFDAISLPESGPMDFEFTVEVEPEFDLPEYKGLTVDRPVFTVTDEMVEAHRKRLLTNKVGFVAKTTGAEVGDRLTADLRFVHEGQTLAESTGVSFRLQPELIFQDGRADGVDERLAGIMPGEARNVDAVIGPRAANPAMRGQPITIEVTVHQIETEALPDLDAELLASFNVDSVEGLNTRIRGELQRQLAYEQDRHVRRNVLDQLLDRTPIELPEDLVSRQEQSTLSRRVNELRDAGFSEDQIRAREIEIRSNAHEETLRSLKEHFLLSQIADAEGIEVSDSDLDEEIALISERTDESVRRVRSRIEKQNLREQLVMQVLERRALDLILDHVTFNDVAGRSSERAVEALDHTVAGEAPPAEAEAEKTDASS